MRALFALALVLVALTGLLILSLILVLIGLILALILLFHAHFLRRFVLRHCRYRSMPRVL